MKFTSKLLPFALLVCCMMACGRDETDSSSDYLAKAKETMSAVFSLYSVPGTPLLVENYPIMDEHGEIKAPSPDGQKFSDLWPFSGSLSAITAIMRCDPGYVDTLETLILPALELYYDDSRTPPAYSSYINTAPPANRYYDDNIWLGLDMADLYDLTGKREYLDTTLMIWRFLESGYDELLGGGFYWCEQKRICKNACSNAPTSVLAIKLYRHTGDEAFLQTAKDEYEWVRRTLIDSTDNLYFDNISLDGIITDWKFAYNSGQMIQAGTMLYNITGEKSYLEQAQETAKSCYDFFFIEYPEWGKDARRIMIPGDAWFKSVMLRGLIELYKTDGNPTYVNAVRKSLDEAWEKARADNGLFYDDCSGQMISETHWVLVQEGMADMYARIAALDI